MKNIPRIFVGDDVAENTRIAANRDAAHYLTRVMRRRDFLAFGGGNEFDANLSDDDKFFIIGRRTPHADPSGDVTLMFAPIKRTDAVIDMATQMGVAAFLPVITEYTVAHHVNWERMQKIATEAAEQSNRNSVPKIMPPVRFENLDLARIVFADERAAHGRACACDAGGAAAVLVGPEGGFSPAEFAALDACGARSVGLGATILRAEVASVVALARVMK